jgi:hypothetical protein
MTALGLPEAEEMIVLDPSSRADADSVSPGDADRECH